MTADIRSQTFSLPLIDVITPRGLEKLSDFAKRPQTGLHLKGMVPLKGLAVYFAYGLCLDEGLFFWDG